MSTPYLPSGSRDLLPTDLIKQEKLRHLLMEIFKSWGYQPVLPPTLESLEALEKGRPQFVKEAFKVIDRDSQLLALRPDLTLPIARLAATRLSSVERPLRLSYIAKVFRQNLHLADERREIYQAGIELIGCKDPKKTYTPEQTNKANLECLSILLQIMDEIGVRDYKIVLSHTDLWKYAGEIFHRVEEQLEIDLSSEFDNLLQKGDFIEYTKAVTKAEERCAKQLNAQPNPSELKAIFDKTCGDSPLNYLKKACFELTGEPDKILEYLDTDSELHQELKAIVALEKIFGKDKFIIDFTLRPDSNYYTGLYFEVVLADSGKPIGKGGRYDNLISCFGASESAIGFSLQIDPLIKLYQDGIAEAEQENKKGVKVPFHATSIDSLLDSINQSIDLRKKHQTVVLD
ncbi:MAG: ATP phosphoribosyltransferase regulatory subunit [Candidatus Caenarcaniphilales bacterium]|nr:ATP phosphoribosyltransferase regulatory subunit [Candidatus Caenarcaniphilales bacterium]